MPKAVALISGGLDSLLAAKMMLDQGVEVEGINFYTGFCHSGHTSAIRHNKHKAKPKRNDALWVAEQLGIKLHIIDIVEDYKAIVINPQHGYGQHVNPCLDCKIFMIKRAKEWMEAHGFDFIVTGEVMGQRPKSQRKALIPIIAEGSGVTDRLLRPLCGKLLPETYPERMGWVQRDKLLALSGRARYGQIALAEQYGFHGYAQPAGGCCVLTDENYARRLQDHWQAKGERNYELEDVILLKAGRHLRLSPTLKLIIGREESENKFLMGYRYRFLHVQAVTHPGALVLVDGVPTAEERQLIAQIAARFSPGRDCETVTVKLHDLNNQEELLTVTPLATDAIPTEWYV